MLTSSASTNRSVVVDTRSNMSSNAAKKAEVSGDEPGR
jgi:hypothetical protein